MKILVVAALALGLTACAGVQSKLAKVQDFTLADVREAKASAIAHHDATGEACWTAAEAWLVERGEARVTDVSKGLASTWQAARNVRRTYDTGLPEAVRFNCALVYAEAKRTARRLFLRAAPGL